MHSESGIASHTSASAEVSQGQMWGVTTYFNPAGYSTKLRNLELFAGRVRQQGLKLLIVDLAFAGMPFSVPPQFGDLILQVRSRTVLWQKERMLNLAIEQLPLKCRKVAWLDGDILFTNDSWVEETSRLLEEHKAVQPFQIAAWLPPGGEYRWETDSTYASGLYNMPGVAFAMRHVNGCPDILYRPDLVHPGFAWAARREILSAHGLYDRFILGGGDFVTMLAMYSDRSALANPNVAGCLCRNQIGDIAHWMDEFHHAVGRDVAYTAGWVLHLWHGSLSDRQYLERYDTLREFDFAPTVDIALDSNGAWEWSSDKPELHRRVKEYFSSRKEDG